MKNVFLFSLLTAVLNVNAQWNKSSSLPNYSAFDVDFPSFNAAYATGDLGALYKSTDAGVTWTEVYNFGPFFNLSDVKFMNADTGIVSIGWGQMITYDGGVNWTQIGTFPKLKICGKMLYTSFVSNDTAYIQNSDDLGNTWSVLFRHYEEHAQPFLFSFLSADSAYFINPNKLAQAYRTSDRFLSIDTIHIFSGDLTLQKEFDFKDMEHGFMYGSWGELSHPTKTWNIPVDLDGFGVLPVLDLAFTDSKIYASSLYGKIFVSENNGRIWKPQIVPDYTPVYSVAFLNDSIGIAVGNGFYHTANGGIAASNHNLDLRSTFQIFPNPANDIIKLAYPQDLIVQRLQMIDTAGKIVKSFPSDEKSLSVKDIARGVYFLNIHSKAGNVSEKIIVK